MSPVAFVHHSKRSVISRAEREYRALDRLVRRLRPGDFRRRVFDAEAPVPWTVKDALAHIIAWKETGRRSLARQHQTPEFRGSVESERNLRVYAHWRRRSATEVVAAHRAVHRDTMATLRALAEDRFSGLARHPEWPRILDGHSAEHREAIAAAVRGSRARSRLSSRSGLSTRSGLSPRAGRSQRSSSLPKPTVPQAGTPLPSRPRP